MEKKTEMTVSLDVCVCLRVRACVCVCVRVCVCMCSCECVRGRETAPPSGCHSPGNIKAAKGPQASITLHINLFIGHFISDENGSICSGSVETI